MSCVGRSSGGSGGVGSGGSGTGGIFERVVVGHVGVVLVERKSEHPLIGKAEEAGISSACH